MFIRTDVKEALAAVEILNNVRFVPGYVPELLNYQATQAAQVEVATSSKWSAL